MYQTIREKNASVPMPAAVAGVMAKAWEWLGKSTPLRGPLMFSPDYIAEMQVGWGGTVGW